MTRVYEYRHIVGFEETNLVGNVYFANHLRWQGRCREFFLRDHAPGIIAELERGFALVTTRVVCDYFDELRALDEVSIQMKLASLAQNRLTMTFDYYRTNANLEVLVARGEQQVACMRRHGARMIPTPVPEELLAALRPFMHSPQ